MGNQAAAKHAYAVGKDLMVSGLDHIVLRVRKREQAELSLTQLRAGRSLLDLIEVGDQGASTGGADSRLDHFALGVTPFEERALLSHLERHNIDVIEAGPRYGATGEGPAIYVRDPDGNKVELKEALSPGVDVGDHTLAPLRGAAPAFAL